MTGPGMHEPTSEFRGRLERRIVHEMQRQHASAPTPAPGRWQRLRAAAVIVAALGIGAAAGALPAQVQESRQRDQLMATAQAEVQLAEVRAQLAETQLAAVRRQHQVGAASAETLAEAEAERVRMHMALERARLNVLEVQASAAAPRDDLMAPLVRDRDFVRERLLLDLNVAQQQLSLAERVHSDLQSRNRVGLVPGLVVHEAAAELTRVRAEMAHRAGRLQLRQDFLRGGLTAEEVTRRAHRLELMMAVQVVEAKHKLAEARLAHVRELHRHGAADEMEVVTADLELAKSVLELRRIMLQLNAEGATRR